MVRKNNRDSMDKGLLIKLGLGVSPIPVVGEICLAWGFYDVDSFSHKPHPLGCVRNFDHPKNKCQSNSTL